MKNELKNPYRQSTRRNWWPALVEVNSTQLRITRRSGLLRRTKVYSLQFAEVGLASDYEKRDHALRLRIEARQFLIACPTREAAVEWIFAIQTGIGVALPLELRTVLEHRRARVSRQACRWRTAGSVSFLSPQWAGQLPALPPTPAKSELEAGELPARSSWHGEFDAKWRPKNRRSRITDKDFPHLAQNSSWEGKPVLYRGRWALVGKQRLQLLSHVNSGLTTYF